MDKYLIKGKLYDPILFGDEDEDWVPDGENPTCGDCGCHVGEQHLENCDIERCPCCGLQFISCDCGVKYQLLKDDEKFLPYYIEQQKKDNLQLEKDLEELFNKKRTEREDTEM